MNKTISTLAIVVCGLFAAPAFAADCAAQATEKKLAGAAKTSHIKKCMADAKG